MSHFVLQPHPIDALFATIIDCVLPFYMARAAILGLFEAFIPATAARLASVEWLAGSGAAAIDEMRPFLRSHPSGNQIPRYCGDAMALGRRLTWRPLLTAVKQKKRDRPGAAAAMTERMPAPGPVPIVPPPPAAPPRERPPAQPHPSAYPTLAYAAPVVR